MKQMSIVISYPNTVSSDEIKDYAQDALMHWGGQRHPDDHLFGTVVALKRDMKVKRDPSSQNRRT